MSTAKQAKQSRPLPGIFLSHSRADAAWCQPCVEALRKEGYAVWYHEDERPEGEAWLEASQEQIRTRDVFVVILSPDSYAAPQVRQEINLALTAQRSIMAVNIRDLLTLGVLDAETQIDARRQTISETVRQIISIIQRHAAFLALWGPGETRLKTLGFVPTRLRQQRVILPPVCAIPAGPFLMGNDDDSGEAPQFTCTTSVFQMTTYPLTIAEYACAIEAKMVRRPFNWAAQVQQLDHPVVGLEWGQALAYATWLAWLTGQEWRVPSEAEWEKAARGTDGRRYPWGNEWDPDRANIGEKHRGGTTPVGSYPAGASPYGCQDMAGNVWEWTTTRYFDARYPYGPYRYPYDPQDGREQRETTWNERNGPYPYRVIRGGAWEDDAEMGETTTRSYQDIPGGNLYYPGVRFVCGVTTS